MGVPDRVKDHVDVQEPLGNNRLLTLPGRSEPVDFSIGTSSLLTRLIRNTVLGSRVGWVLPDPSVTTTNPYPHGHK